MLLFGHVGLTTAAVKLSEKLLRVTSGQTETGVAAKSSGEKIDYRLVVIGSMLPDIIDKSIWLLTSSTFQWSGRGYAHTFIFSLTLLLSGMLLRKLRNYGGLMTLGIGSFFHLVFDQIWLNTSVLWWPFAGDIMRRPIEGWFGKLWDNLLHDPYVLTSETVGLFIVAIIGIRLLTRKRIIHFLRTGDIS